MRASCALVHAVSALRDSESPDLVYKYTRDTNEIQKSKRRTLFRMDFIHYSLYIE